MASEHSLLPKGSSAFEELFLPAPFVDKINVLIRAYDILQQQNQFTGRRSYQNKSFLSEPLLFGSMLSRVENDTSTLENYFVAARAVLKEVCLESDIARVYASISAVRDVKSCVLRAGEYLPNLMTALEAIKFEYDTATANVFQKTIPPQPRLQRNTNINIQDGVQKRLQQHYRDSEIKIADAFVTTGQLHKIATNINTAVASWRELMTLSTTLDTCTNIAREWADLNKVVIAGFAATVCELRNDIENINATVVTKKLHIEYLGQPKNLLESLRWVVPPGARRLPYQTIEEKEIVLK